MSYVGVFHALPDVPSELMARELAQCKAQYERIETDMDVTIYDYECGHTNYYGE